MSLLSLRWKAVLPGLHTPLQSKLKMLPLHDNSIRCWRYRKQMAGSFRETFLGVGEVNPCEGFCFMLGCVGSQRHRRLVDPSWMDSGQSFLLSGLPSSTPTPWTKPLAHTFLVHTLYSKGWCKLAVSSNYTDMYTAKFKSLGKSEPISFTS